VLTKELITYNFMITYELAKELKEAGFPIVRDSHDYMINTVGGTECTRCGERLTKPETSPFCDLTPTLSELIEACGDKFFELSKLSDGWVSSDHYLNGEGKTPEEAVAKLWLALNK